MTQDLEVSQRASVLGMLTDRKGAFDEGLRTEAGSTWRVINEPADSPSAEIESTRRMSIDIETFLPRRFEYASAFPSPDDYWFNLVVGPRDTIKSRAEAEVS